MRSRATPRFWAAYRELPAEVRDAAQKAYRLFHENPKHPGLQFKKVHDREPVYSVRVTVAYRAVGVLDNDEVTWFWIGSHAEYDRLLKDCSFVGPTPPLELRATVTWSHGTLGASAPSG